MHDAAIEREVPGFGYTATSDGEVYSHRSGRRRRLSPRLHHSGYHYVNVRRGAGPCGAAQVTLHGLILLTFVGPRPSPKHESRHLNGNPLDNRASNLKWGTSAENKADCVRHGTGAWLRRGEAAIASKLTEHDVRRIEARARAGETQRLLAEEFGITQRHVSAIKLHETWTHLWPSAA